MSRFFLILTLISSYTFMAKADPTGVIVNYSFHNQIYGSVLTVDAAGTVVILEHTCCQPHTVTINTKLAPDLVQNLIKAVGAAKAGQLTIQPGTPTTLGSLAGDFLGNDGTDQPVVIEKVERNPTLGQPDKVTLNTSPAAKNIKDLVEALVTTKMPSLFFMSLPKQIPQVDPTLLQ
jgi:hypothetical protein